MNLSEFCLNSRLKLGLSQETLVRKLAVSFATINRWENGKALPQKLTLYRFKKFCEENGIEFVANLALRKFYVRGIYYVHKQKT